MLSKNLPSKWTQESSWSGHSNERPSLSNSKCHVCKAVHTRGRLGQGPRWPSKTPVGGQLAIDKERKTFRQAQLSDKLQPPTGTRSCLLKAIFLPPFPHLDKPKAIILGSCIPNWYQELLPLSHISAIVPTLR